MAATLTQPQIAKALEGITGPFLVGTAFTTFLSGITLTQCYTYFSRFSSDRAIYRWAVWSLVVLDVLHTVFCWVTLWLWDVRHFGSLAAVTVSPWSFAVDPVMCGLAASIVQFFYAYRIYILNKKSLLIPGIVVFISLFQLGWSAGATYEIFKIQLFHNFQQWQYGVAAWLGAAAACDALITITLCSLLVKTKNGGMKETNSVIDKLVRVTVETNGLTFCVAVLDVILFATRPDAAHVAPNLCLVKLYFNSFLVSLNSRTELQRRLGSSREVKLTPMGKSSEGSYGSNSQPSRIIHSHMNSSVNGITSMDQNPGVHVVTTSAIVSEKVLGDSDSWEEEMIGGHGEKRPTGHSANIVGGKNNTRQFDMEANHPYRG